MKKLLLLMITFALVLTMAACGEDKESDTPSDESNTPSAPVGSDTDDKAMASLINWMIDGTFSYDFTMTSEGPDGQTEGSGSMAMDGENLAVTSETTVDGQTVKSRIIMKDGVTYIVDDTNKFIMKAPGGMNPTAGMMTDYTGVTKTGEGTGEINGKTLSYEDYTENEMGATVRFYLDGGQVYGVESEYEGYKTVMIITNAKDSVPASAFELPTGYMEM